MIVNKNLAPVTQVITALYWQDEINVARIYRIVQYILEREAAQPAVAVVEESLCHTVGCKGTGKYAVCEACANNCLHAEA